MKRYINDALLTLGLLVVVAAVAAQGVQGLIAVAVVGLVGVPAAGLTRRAGRLAARMMRLGNL